MNRHDDSRKQESSRDVNPSTSFWERLGGFLKGLFKKSNASSPDTLKAKLFIGNLSYQAKEIDLKNLFEKYGCIIGISIIINRRNGQPKGFAFVEMSSADEAKKALALNGTTVHGRSISVSAARFPDKRNRNGKHHIGRGSFRGPHRPPQTPLRKEDHREAADSYL